MIKTTYENQNDILEAIKTLHCPDGFDADVTYGNGAFWNGTVEPKYKFDITPLKDGVVEADSRLLPLEPCSIVSLVFDPPFLTYVRNGREHKGGAMAMSKRFGGYYKYEELEDHYQETISEAHRVLKKSGKLIFKCQDIVHNHKLHLTHVKVIQWAEIEGFRPLDMFVLIAKHRMPGPQKGTQRHARIFHSYFLVFEKQ